MTDNKQLLSEALDLIIYSNTKSPLLEMREWFSNDLEFAKFIERFSGCTIVLPEMTALAECANKVLAAELVRQLHDSKNRKDLIRWGIQEGKLVEMASRFSLSKDKIKEIGVHTLRKYEEIKNWKETNKRWIEKNIPFENKSDSFSEKDDSLEGEFPEEISFMTSE